MLASDGKVVISTELDNSGFEKGIKTISGQLGGLGNTLKNIAVMLAAAFSTKKIIEFATESSQAARTMSDALTGLKSILAGQGRSFSDAQDFIEEYVEDGLIPATNAINAYKNLASRGYDDGQIKQVMTALKDASAYGRQASYTMGEAVESATEGLKNENSILVDNAGVTKNIAKMWDEYAASIGTTANNLTQQQKIQAEVSGILKETKYQTGDAATVAGTLSGQLQQLSFRFNDLKVAVGNAINPIIQTLLPIINTAITSVTKFANAVASVVGALFGKASVQTSTLANSNDSVASSASAGAEAEEELEAATTAAGKAAKKSLANFDELNILQSNTGSGESPSGTSGGSVSSGTNIVVTTEVEDTFSPKLQAIVDKFKELIEPLKQIDFAPAVEEFGRLKEAIAPLTTKLFEGLEWAWYNILVPIAEWTIEDVLPAFLDLLSAALDFLNVAIEGLKPMGQWLWDEFLKPLAQWTGGVIIDTINGFADALTRISDWVSNNQEGINNFITLIGSIGGAFGALSIAAKIAEYIGAVGAMAPEVGLLAAMFPKLSGAIASLGAWITGTLVPAITGGLAAIAAALGISVGWLVAIIAAVAAAVAAIIIYWDEISAFFSELWANISAWAASAWKDISTFASHAWEGISTAASACWNAIVEFFSPAIEWFSKLFVSIGQTFSNVFYNIGVLASGCWEIIKVVWGIVSGWFNENVVQPVAEFFSGLWNGFTEAASQAWEAVKEIFGKVASFFEEVFSEAWESVVAVFSIAGDIFTDIKDGILTVFKTVVNGIIKGLNGAISIPFNGINTALQKIKDINILGLTPFSGLNTISVPQIPYLAKGAVLPPNKPFLAMVGDQRHGTNIEAPLATIQEAVALVMQDNTSAMMAGFTASVEVQREILQAVLGIQIGDDVIGNAMSRYQRKMAVVNGGLA